MRRASPSSGSAPRRRRHRPIRRRWREWHKSACGLSFTGAHRPDRIGQRLTSGERVKHERCTGRHCGALKEQVLSEEAARMGGHVNAPERVGGGLRSPSRRPTSTLAKHRHIRRMCRFVVRRHTSDAVRHLPDTAAYCLRLLAIVVVQSAVQLLLRLPDLLLRLALQLLSFPLELLGRIAGQST